MKKLPITLAVAFVVAVAAGIGWFMRQDRENRSMTFYGNVDLRQIMLAFEASGRVTELRVDEGDRVKAGDVIGALDTRTIALQAAQAQAQVATQEHALGRLRNGSRPQEIAEARSRVVAAEADALRAGQDLARLQGIAQNTQGRGVSAQDVDRANSSVRIAKAQLAERREALRLVELGPRKEDVAAAEAQLAAAQAQLALLNYQIELGSLKAPVDATVRSRLQEPCDMVTPQRPVFALALTHPKWVRIYVSEPDLGKVKPGMAASITTDSHPDEAIVGKVGYISSVAEFTPKSVQTVELRTSLVYEVRVLVDDPNDQLRLGQPATVELRTDTVQ